MLALVSIAELTEKGAPIMTSMRDVAERCGVSIATVSRALSGTNPVSQDVADRIQEAVRELGYRPNRVARNLRSNQSSTIGLVVADIQNPFFAGIGRAVEDAAIEHGYAVFFCNTDENPEKEEIYLCHLADENVAGIIFAPTNKAQKSLNSGKLTELTMPVVVIDRTVARDDTDLVLIDNVAAARELTEHLIGHGHRRIAGLFGAKSSTGAERRHGFQAALEHHGIPLDAGLELMLSPFEEEGYRATRELLDRDVPPEAILVSNGRLAVGAYRALMESGRRCPEEVAFASFDESAWTSLVKPSVTLIAQPTREIGKAAVELLLGRIAEPHRPVRQVVLRHELRLGHSCGCP